jgi:putative transposase
VSRFIDEHRGVFGVESICWTLGVSASAHFKLAMGKRSAVNSRTSGCSQSSARPTGRNFEADGYRRMWKAQMRAGEHVPRWQVQRLMRRAGIQGAKRRGKPWRTTIPDPTATRGPGRARLQRCAAGPALGL